MKYKNIIFDLDGTLLDTSFGIKEAIEYVIKKMELKKIDENEMDSFIGPPIQNSLISHFGFTKEEAQIGADIFRNYYKDVSLLRAIPYDGIYSLMDFFVKNNINVGVATYKREDYAIKLLNEFGFDRYCKVMHGADNLNKMSKANIIEICIKEMECIKSETLYVGDTESDYISANLCNIDFVGVSYGFGFKKNTNYQFEIVNSCKELEIFLKNKN